MIRMIYHELLRNVFLLKQALTLKPSEFKFNNDNYDYFYETYNTTWLNERCVEIPIVAKLLQREEGSVLEIGNVMSNYRMIDEDHVVIDKYEQEEGVINKDILDFNTDKKFNLIISISTIEHIGFGNGEMCPEKAFSALDRIKSLLAPGGTAIITIPRNFNKVLDEHLDSTNVSDEIYYMKRTSEFEWKQCNKEELKDVRYNFPYRCANGITILIMNGEKND